MRMSKRHLQIIDALQYGGHIWTAGNHAYLARKDEDGRFKSELLHGKIFETFKSEGIISVGLKSNIWRLK